MTTPIAKTRYDGIVATDIVRAVGETVHELLESHGLTVERACYIVPGEIAWDECDCTQLAQSISQVAPSTTPPAPATDVRQTPCGPGLAVVSVTLSLSMCVPVTDNDGTAPTCDVLAGAAVQLETYRWLVRKDVACYLRQLRAAYQVLEFGVNTATTVGPQGGCVGISLTYWFALHDDCC